MCGIYTHTERYTDIHTYTYLSIVYVVLDK